MNLQELEQKVADAKARGAALLDSDKELSEVTFEITNVPYKIFEEYRSKVNGSKGEDKDWVKPSRVGSRMYIWLGITEPVRIFIYSVPVQIKTTHQVIEEISEPEPIPQ